MPKLPFLLYAVTIVMEFWKITLMVAPETIKIFQSSMPLLVAENIFERISKIFL